MTIQAIRIYNFRDHLTGFTLDYPVGWVNGIYCHIQYSNFSSMSWLADLI